ncbi:diphosphate--fructose-6-phosphate 1-phosphotransferase [Oceanobacillus caeni]|uniref:diphosphate--fructose-6-phosphate 1-phosphotransferase n=1 Tax=Oceanobacillus caeni TaxID=405946 RepID=UPI001956A848
MNVLVAQSGGPTPVINSTLYGVVKEAVDRKKINKVYGSINGMEGILNNDLIELNCFTNQLNTIKHQPGAFLSGSRYQLTEDDLQTIVTRLDELHIDVLFYIGGNGSAVTITNIDEICQDRNFDIQCIFVPKTIDNDIEGTDHTPGYISASIALDRILSGIELDFQSLRSRNQIEIVEVMGGNSGWLMAAGAARKRKFPILAYLPEKEWEMQQILEDVEKTTVRHQSAILLIPDHMKIKHLQSEINKNNPRNKYNGGISYKIANVIQQHIAIKTKITIPSSIYTCSNGALLDLEEAELIGREAVTIALAGETGKMVGVERVNHDPYKINIKPVQLSRVCGEERVLPSHYWDDVKQLPTLAFQEYIHPFIDLNASSKSIKLYDLMQLKS